MHRKFLREGGSPQRSIHPLFVDSRRARARCSTVWFYSARPICFKRETLTAR